MKKLLLVAAVLFTFHSSTFAISDANVAVNTTENVQAILDIEFGNEGTESFMCDAAGWLAEAYCNSLPNSNPMVCQIVGMGARMACENAE
jgi:hypothetical protein